MRKSFIRNMLKKNILKLFALNLSVVLPPVILLMVIMSLLLLPRAFTSAQKVNHKADRTLVTVNDRKVTVQDFIDFYQTRPRIARWNSQENNQSDPDDVLEALIGKILMVQEAYRLYPKALKDHEGEVAAFEQRCLINYVSEKQINHGIEISEQEVAERIPENRKIEVHLRRIVTATQEEAARLKKQIEKGADFSSLAKQFSLGEEAEKGGDIGYMTFDKGIFPKKVVEEIFQQKEGEIGNPAKIREGFALFQVLGKRKVDAATLQRVKHYIQQQITLERKRERWDQLFEQLKKDSSMVINEALFKEMEMAMAQNRGKAALERMRDLEIARVNDRPIRLNEIIPDKSDFAFGGDKPWKKDIASLRRVLDRNIKVRLVSDYARRYNYDQSPEIKKNIARFKEDLMVKRLIAEKVYKDLTIGSEECRAYYQQHLSEYKVPEQIRIDAIMVQDETAAADLLNQLKQGADFAKLSQQHSAPEALRFKDFFARGGSGMGGDFEEKVFQLQSGEISEIIRTAKGFFIVKMLERRKEGASEFSTVESGIREKLLSAKKEKTLSDYVTSLRQGSQITINKPLFREIVTNVQ